MCRNKHYLGGSQKNFRIKIALVARRSTNVFAISIQYLAQPTLQVLVTLAIGQIVDKNDAMCWIIEDATGILMTDRSANIEQFNEIGSL